MSDGCQNYDKGQEPPRTLKRSEGSLERAGSVTLDHQTAHDAELMLWNFLYCMDRGIIPPKSGWVREAVAQTRKKLADVTKAASPNKQLT